MTLNKHERRHIAELQRRADHVRHRIETWDHTRATPTPGSQGALGHWKAELAALEWVFQLVDEIDDEDQVPPTPATPDGEG